MVAFNKEQLKSNSIRSIKWTLLGTVIPKLISPVITIWLIKILNPLEYGVLSISTAIVGFAMPLQGIGLIEFLIRDKRLNKLRENTIFWSNLFLAFLVAVILNLLIPVFSEVYHVDSFREILPALSIVIVLNSLQLVPNGLLQKRMQFKKIFYIQLFPLVLIISVTLPLAIFGWGIWSIVIGQLITASISAIVYLIFSNWLPSKIFSFKLFTRMIGFGKWVVFEKYIEYLYSNLDIILVGFYYDMPTVGAYAAAKYFVTIVFTMLNGSIGAISLPMLSHLQDSLDDLKSGFFSISKRIVFFNLPVLVGIVLLSSKVVPIIFPKKWDSLPMLIAIMVIGEGIMRNIWVQRDIFKLLGKPAIYPKSILVNLLFSVVFYFMASKYSVFVFSLAKIANDILYFSIQSNIVSRVLKFKPIEYYKIFKPALISTIFMGCTITLFLYLASVSLIHLSIVLLLIVVLISSAVYFIVYYIIDRINLLLFYTEIKSIFK